MRPLILLGMLLASSGTYPAFSQGPDRMLEAILRAEDHRALRAEELAVLLRGLASPDSVVAGRAIRALGRLERPVLLPRLFPLLAHPLPTIRAAAAQAVAQAAQGFRGDSTRSDGAWDALLGALGERVAAERNPAVRGMLALSLGRIPYARREEILQAQERLLSLSESGHPTSAVELARGMETLLRLTLRRAPPSEVFLFRLRQMARAESGDPRVRRSALAALLGAQAADSQSLSAAARAGDPLLRRLALTGVDRLPEGADRAARLQAGLADSSPLVRYEALRSATRVNGRAGCPQLREAAHDPTPMVALLALDLLGSTCPGDSLAAALLLAALTEPSASWHRAAHALVSLARLSPARAGAPLATALPAPWWQLRMYAARAAAVLKDTAALRTLARDRVANVREAALGALRELSGHASDSLYRAALSATDYQLVLTAALALGGSAEREAGVRALLPALDRITRERRETSRDPRVALLVRLRELGSPELAPRLLPYLGDFDPVVADSAAALLSAWTGRAHRAAPRRLPAAAVSLREVERLRHARLRVTLASGGVFELELLVDEAPLTVLRVARLAARGYYDGLTWHRVAPNFVIQGGGPGANEYAGDGPFMRDELGPLSHERGTLGISTRGRDTGDAQWFINLIDNTRLDYDYTVWGRVTSGMGAVDAVLEGEVIRRVEVRPR